MNAKSDNVVALNSIGSWPSVFLFSQRVVVVIARDPQLKKPIRPAHNQQIDV